MTLQKFKLKDKNVSIDPAGYLNVPLNQNTKYVLKPGNKVLYSGSRGSYHVGYYLGVAPNGKDAVCLLDGYGLSISRIFPDHLFIVDWTPQQTNWFKELEATFQEYKSQLV